jgi:A118 family predicted phage portal protein
VQEWSAWYSGDPDQLQSFYAPRTGATSVDRAAQHRGGVVGKLARWWWGTPTSPGEQRAKLHVPLAADICGTSADLLFSEPLRLTGEDDSVSDFLGELQDHGLESRLHEGGEVAAALGGTYLRSRWDSEVSPLPWTEVAHPDGALPEWRAGRLHAVNLWTELAELRAGTTHRLVERHEPGRIQYALYAGTGTNLGKTVPLTEHYATEHLALIVDEAGGQDTLTQRLTCSYVPNMLPNRADRRSLEGRSDLQGVTPLLDALDEAYSSWWRDIRHAKARLHVPAQYLQSNGVGEAASVDVDREVYVPVEGVLGTGKDGLMIHAQQFAIRVAEHSQTCREWKEAAIESAGYSTNTLSSDGGGAITAAEVHAKNRRSYMTRGKKVRYWRTALREHLAAQVDVANGHLRAGLPRSGEVRVEFPEGVQESPAALAQFALSMRNAEAASTDTLVRLVNPDWSDEQVDAEVAKISAERDGGEPLPLPDDAGL